MASKSSLTAESRIGDWLKHPAGGALLRSMLTAGGQNEAVLRPVRMLALHRLVSLSKGAITQDAIDDLVKRANAASTGEHPDLDELPEQAAAPDADDVPRLATPEVAVVIGVGGMGLAIARRQGASRQLLLADYSHAALTDAAEELRGEGFEVITHQLDVSDAESVAALAQTAASVGPVTQVILTAGLSPTQAPASAIIAVDLVGVALVLDAFGQVIAPGAAGVVIASMAAYGAIIPPEVEQELAYAPATRLSELDAVRGIADAAAAYAFAKRANQIRVQRASVDWGRRGGRVNSISPGVIATPMGRQELDGDHGDIMRGMIEGSGAGRIGTPQDIADAASFLLSNQASFITGIDLLVDGGVVAWQQVG